MFFFVFMTAATTATTALVRSVAVCWAPTRTYLRELDSDAPASTAMGDAIKEFNAWSAQQEPDPEQDRLWPVAVAAPCEDIEMVRWGAEL